MAWLFGITLFVSALLLFWVQPMIAKMLLPLLGGAPAVWNTCMVFFQAMLLAGYACAHFVTTRLSLRSQLILHATLLLLAGAFLPFRVSEERVQSLAADSNPSWWLLGCLATTAGLPFFIVATGAPLLQRWFSTTRHRAAGDPYFLYGASNAGSLFALIGYPLLVEPNFHLREQLACWAGAYGLMAILVIACGTVVLKAGSRLVRRSNESEESAETSPVRFTDTLAMNPLASSFSPSVGEGTGEGASWSSRAQRAQEVRGVLSWRRRLHWVALAFVPSSLMLGVTNYLATDIASVPLLWVVPLALYLTTFILAFARRELIPFRWLARALPVGALALTFPILSRATQPVWLLVMGHLLFFWVASMVCHRRLSDDRPGVDRLTEFYLWISVGGALGGVFNVLIAPRIFNSVIEYPLAITLACLLRPALRPGKSGPGARGLDFAFPALLGALTVSLAFITPVLELSSVHLRNVLTIGIPAVLGYFFVDRPLRFGLGLGAILMAGWFALGPYGKTLKVERDFFGVSRVTQTSSGTFRHLVHGNTLHGRQFVETNRQCEPLTYYHRSGPLGDVFARYAAEPASPNVAVIGLGAGSMACYAQSGEKWAFYEIDPAIIRIAQNTNYFTYLSHCASGELRFIQGDARLRLREAADGRYGLIVLDAFSSDVIPVHLLTRQAVELYLSKLAAGGLLAFHISNRYLELEPVVGRLAEELHLICRSRDDSNLSREEMADGREESHWVVLARRKEDLGALNRNSRWLEVNGQGAVWTDDFSNILSVFKWR
jgi:hypothetical protein